MAWPDDRGDQLLHVGFGGRERAGVDAVAEHRDAVGDAKHLVEPVRDVDHADAARRDRANGVEQDLLLVAGSADVGSSKISMRSLPISALQISVICR